MMPSDPMILLSFVNTQLRDNYASLEDLCQRYNASPSDICSKLASVDYRYDADMNRFV